MSFRSFVDNAMGGTAGMLSGLVAQPLMGLFGHGPKIPDIPTFDDFSPSGAQDQWWMSSAGMTAAMGRRDEDRLSQGLLGRRHALGLPSPDQTTRTALGEGMNP